ncbi:MAG TPA: lipid-A-disaccharide synthase N-terminal domain-containing protein [Chryseosolibacter sp.]|nr:lipid-A-disaccharide synthase N-terminal domain-containing protein [Chryseosolibacter sp.]
MESWERYLVYSIGFLSQGLFAARLIVQWILSEREGKVVSPVIFWQLSLFASYLFILYGILQNDFVIILGQALAYVIYVRNLQLEGAWRTFPRHFKYISIILPAATIAWVLLAGMSGFSYRTLIHPVVMAGAAGQMLLNIRFVYQWYYSERVGGSLFPVGFWYMTTFGSLCVVVYAIYFFDPVLLAAQGLGLVASLRNIQLHFKTKEAG